MSRLPIPNTEELRLDPFYRYKRDSSNVIMSGKFYLITNFRTICKQLNLKTIEEEKMVVAYFKKQLKQPVGHDLDQGTLKIKSLPISPEEIFERFIKRYVLCKTCGYPELGEDRVCKSCGKSN